MPMYLSLSLLSSGVAIPLPEQNGLPKSAHVIDRESILAVNAALATGRPLLVRGEPGTGKSQLARAVAQVLGRAFVQHAVDSRTETRDLLWSLDAVARLAEAQLVGSLRDANTDDVHHRIAIENFVHPGPLWWAFDWKSAEAQAERVHIGSPITPTGWQTTKGVVVLIDEIDKADPAVPNGLLDALGHGRFDVPGRTAVSMEATNRPLVLITTNEERSLPDAFLRRCLVLHLSLPSAPAALLKTLVERGRAHFDAQTCSDEVLRAAAEQLTKDREEFNSRGLSPPGLAEYIDLLRAVSEQEKSETQQLDLLLEISKFAFRKHQQVGSL